jgi:glycosyltransferase involved in cell wall biosynthesis
MLRAEDEARLERAAGRAISFVRLAPNTGYYAAKNRGFEHTQSEVVVFGDADCWPEDEWLESLVLPFDDENVQVVAGRTTYRDDLLGTAATTIDFMYFEAAREGCTRNFYANNVAFRRDTFERARYLHGSFYRGNCQVLGLKLQELGISVVFVPGARTTHRFPDTAKDFVRLRLLRGADAVELTPHLARAYLPRPYHAVARAPGLEAVTLSTRLLFSLRSINAQDMPDVHGARWLACAALTLGISTLDATGACLKRLGLDRVLLTNPEHAALSYHENVDGLA